MKLTFKAIMARFNGNAWKARDYCLAMAATYPRLEVEYKLLADECLSMARPA